MKKLFVLLVSAIITSAVFPQDGNLKKQFYLRFGASLPTWKYYGLEDKKDFPENTKRIGGIFEVGSIYMLNGIKLPDGMRIGINVDYLSLNMNRFTFSDDAFKTTFLFLGSKIGPSFSYSPVKHLVFDTYIKFNPVWSAFNYDKSDDSELEDDLYLGFMGIKYSLGLNVGYSVLMLGFEYNPGYAKLRYYDQEENELTREYMGNADDLNGNKTSVPCFNMTLGLSF